MMDPSKEQTQTDPWETGTFGGNRRHQLREDAKLSFAEKIKWVEEAQRLAEAFEKARPFAKPLVPKGTK